MMWNKHLVYKRKDGGISHCVPADKQRVQKDLNALGINKFKANLYASLVSENKVKNVESVLLLNKQLKWLESVKDFTALTDQEFMDFVHCATPDDHEYAHWIDADVMHKIDKTNRDDWADIDKNGQVTLKEQTSV